MKMNAIYLMVLAGLIPTWGYAQDEKQGFFQKIFAKPLKQWEQWQKKREIEKAHQQYMAKKNAKDDAIAAYFNKKSSANIKQWANEMQKEQEAIERDKYWAASQNFTYNQPSTWFERNILVPWRERKIFRSLYPTGSQPTFLPRSQNLLNRAIFLVLHHLKNFPSLVND